MNILSLPSWQQPATAWARGLSMVVLAAGAWAWSGTAQARDDIHWSIGVNSPGVSVGVSNGPAVVYGYPSYGYPSYGYPVYEQRPVVVYPRPVVVHRPVVVQPYPVYYGGYQKHWKGHKHGHRGHKRHHRGHDWDD